MTTGATAAEADTAVSPWTAVVWAAVIIAALTMVSYLGWLGWDQHKHRIPGTTSFEGPYEAWQVLGLAVTLMVLTVVASWRGFWLGAVVMIPLAITVTFSLDASGSRSIGANLWVVGAAFLAVGSFGLIPLVAAATRGIRSLFGRWPYRTSKGQT